MVRCSIVSSGLVLKVTVILKAPRPISKILSWSYIANSLLTNAQPVRVGMILSKVNE